MSLGVLDTPLTWREVPQDEIGDVQQRQATFVAPTPHGPVTFFVNGYTRRFRGMEHAVLYIDFGKDLGWTNRRVRDIRHDWWAYKSRNPRRRSILRYLERSHRHDDLRYYTRFLSARRYVSLKAFTIISTIADIVQQWITTDGHTHVAYDPATEAHARLYATMVRVLAPKARIDNEPESGLDMHIWRLRP